jgi:uncharacterized protein
MNHEIQHALNLTVPQFRLDINHGIHGIAHWSRVWRNGRELCEVMGLDPTVPALFAFLHDSQRYDDGLDSDHGPRAVAWLERLFSERKLDIKAVDFHLLTIAIRDHSYGETKAHPIVQVCWDSDRLDLGRVGTIPRAQYLCTPHAKKADTIHRALNRSIGMPQSNTVFPDWLR